MSDPREVTVRAGQVWIGKYVNNEVTITSVENGCVSYLYSSDVAEPCVLSASKESFASIYHFGRDAPAAPAQHQAPEPEFIGIDMAASQDETVYGFRQPDSAVVRTNDSDGPLVPLSKPALPINRAPRGGTPGMLTLAPMWRGW